MSLPTRMRALVLSHDGYSTTSEGPAIADAADWLEEAVIDVPQPAAGQVLIKLRRASVNPSDLHYIKGEYGQPRRRGVPAGFEGCGDVVAAGEGAFGASLMGQRVAFAVTPEGSGAWAEYALSDASSCIALHPGVSDDDGAAQIVNPLTAMAMVELAAEHGDSLVLTAAGSQLGKLMLGLARDRGLKALAVVRRQAQAESLKSLGAAEVLVSTDPHYSASVAASFAKYKPRTLLDALGGSTSSALFHAMPSHSRWVIYGKLESDTASLQEPGQLIFMHKRIEGFWLVNWMRNTPVEQKTQVVKQVQERFASGQWRTDVSARLPLSSLLAELALATQLRDGKVLIHFD